ncbi:MAG: hypothetical protein CL607_21655 [Anaerolineaceae bacterium]|nr:hypothetical protein [Anaerolineaceae bacterium]MCA9881989.1 hypothetical protein [Anaerolineae bacterium]MCA9891431.1 hypothetical protein [Anaerolineae bacterium]
MSKNGKHTELNRIDALLASVTEEMLGGEFETEADSQGLRVERILLDLIRPDPIQPRRMLPDDIHHAFHNNQLTPSNALREMVRKAQVTARQHGRPFSNVMDLITNEDHAESASYSPEESLLRELLTLALTIRDDGQVNPLTVVDVSQGVSFQFRIETGERRYWASWLLRDFVPDYHGDGMVPCIIVPPDTASPFRQAKENTARSGLSAIALARQAALLLLAVHDYELPEYAVNNDFYRQALDLHLRGKPKASVQILAAMGGISKMRFSQIKALLGLADEAMELADLYQIEEKKLRYVLNLEPTYHAEMVRQIIDYRLTSKQVRELCDPKVESTESQLDTFDKATLRVARLLRKDTHSSGDEIARALLSTDDADMARLRIQRFQTLLSEAEKWIDDHV